MKMRPAIMLVLMLILLAGCGPKGQTGGSIYICADGTKVGDSSQCSGFFADQPEPAVDNSVPAVPDQVDVADTGAAISSEADARQAFEDYVASNGLEYHIVDIERTGEGYVITNQHDENSGGKRQMIVSEDGRVYYKLPLA